MAVVNTVRRCLPCSSIYGENSFFIVDQIVSQLVYFMLVQFGFGERYRQQILVFCYEKPKRSVVEAKKIFSFQVCTEFP